MAEAALADVRLDLTREKEAQKEDPFYAPAHIDYLTKVIKDYEAGKTRAEKHDLLED